MSVLTVITRGTGALTLARFGYRVARAREEKLVVLCLEEGDGEAAGEPAIFAPGDDIPEVAGATVAEVCGELERGERADELSAPDDETRDPAPAAAARVLPDPEVEVRWLRSPRPLPAVLAQVRATGASLLIAGKDKSRRKAVALARKLFTAAPCHTLLTRLGEAEESDAEAPGAGDRSGGGPAEGGG